MSRGLDVGFVPGIDPLPAGGTTVVRPLVNLISRVYVTTPGTTPVPVPAGARRARARCIGAGGSALAQSGTIGGGGGGAFAAGNLAVSGVNALTAVVGNIVTGGNDGQDSSVTNGTDIILAKGGFGTTGASSAAGGFSGQCIGEVRRSGGAGSAGGDGSFGTAGQNGGAGGQGGGSYQSRGGGGAAGDIGDADTLRLGGNGAGWSGVTYAAGIGGGGVNPGGGSISGSPNPGIGIVVIEFWSF